MKIVAVEFARTVAPHNVLLGVNMKTREAYSVGNMNALRGWSMERKKGKNLCGNTYDPFKMTRAGLIGM